MRRQLLSSSALSLVSRRTALILTYVATATTVALALPALAGLPGLGMHFAGAGDAPGAQTWLVGLGVGALIAIGYVAAGGVVYVLCSATTRAEDVLLGSRRRVVLDAPRAAARDDLEGQLSLSEDPLEGRLSDVEPPEPRPMPWR